LGCPEDGEAPHPGTGPPHKRLRLTGDPERGRMEIDEGPGVPGGLISDSDDSDVDMTEEERPRTKRPLPYEQTEMEPPSRFRADQQQDRERELLGLNPAPVRRYTSKAPKPSPYQPTREERRQARIAGTTRLMTAEETNTATLLWRRWREQGMQDTKEDTARPAPWITRSRPIRHTDIGTPTYQKAVEALDYAIDPQFENNLELRSHRLHNTFPRNQRDDPYHTVLWLLMWHPTAPFYLPEMATQQSRLIPQYYIDACKARFQAVAEQIRKESGYVFTETPLDPLQGQVPNYAAAAYFRQLEVRVRGTYTNGDRAWVLWPSEELVERVMSRLQDRGRRSGDEDHYRQLARDCLYNVAETQWNETWASNSDPFLKSMLDGYRAECVFSLLAKTLVKIHGAFVRAALENNHGYDIELLNYVVYAGRAVLLERGEITETDDNGFYTWKLRAEYSMTYDREDYRVYSERFTTALRNALDPLDHIPERKDIDPSRLPTRFDAARGNKHGICHGKS
jgi:hypothetical protein